MNRPGGPDAGWTAAIDWAVTSRSNGLFSRTTMTPGSDLSSVPFTIVLNVWVGGAGTPVMGRAWGGRYGGGTVTLRGGVSCFPPMSQSRVDDDWKSHSTNTPTVPVESTVTVSPPRGVEISVGTGEFR